MECYRKVDVVKGNPFLYKEKNACMSVCFCFILFHIVASNPTKYGMMVKDLPRAVLGTYEHVWLESKSAYFSSISSTSKTLGSWKQLNISNNRIISRIRGVAQASVTAVLEKMKKFSTITKIQEKPNVSSAFIQTRVRYAQETPGGGDKLLLVLASTIILVSESSGIHGNILFSHMTGLVFWSVIPIKRRDCVFVCLFVIHFHSVYIYYDQIRQRVEEILANIFGT
jgi:hypothetical protein